MNEVLRQEAGEEEVWDQSGAGLTLWGGKDSVPSGLRTSQSPPHGSAAGRPRLPAVIMATILANGIKWMNGTHHISNFNSLKYSCEKAKDQNSMRTEGNQDLM